MTKSLEEIDSLKRNWRQDGCYDLEEAPGFEDYHDELLAYRKQVEAERAEKTQKEHDRLASMVCPQTFALLQSKGDYGQDQSEIFYQNCLVEKCAWWMPNSKCCAIAMAGFKNG